MLAPLAFGDLGDPGQYMNRSDNLLPTVQGLVPNLLGAAVMASAHRARAMVHSTEVQLYCSTVKDDRDAQKELKYEYAAQ
jgi:hypothetical protein